MKKTVILLFGALFTLNTAVSAQNNYAGHYTKSLHEVMEEVSKRFHVRLKYNVDTIGKVLPYADFRIRPYSEICIWKFCYRKKESVLFRCGSIRPIRQNIDDK